MLLKNTGGIAVGFAGGASDVKVKVTNQWLLGAKRPVQERSQQYGIFKFGVYCICRGQTGKSCCYVFLPLMCFSLIMCVRVRGNEGEIRGQGKQQFNLYVPEKLCGREKKEKVIL